MAQSLATEDRNSLFLFTLLVCDRAFLEHFHNDGIGATSREQFGFTYTMPEKQAIRNAK